MIPVLQSTRISVVRFRRRRQGVPECQHHDDGVYVLKKRKIGVMLAVKGQYFFIGRMDPEKPRADGRQVLRGPGDRLLLGHRPRRLGRDPLFLSGEGWAGCRSGVRAGGRRLQLPRALRTPTLPFV